jgi:hypothetical protein
MPCRTYPDMFQYPHVGSWLVKPYTTRSGTTSSIKFQYPHVGSWLVKQGATGEIDGTKPQFQYPHVEGRTRSSVGIRFSDPDRIAILLLTGFFGSRHFS